MVRPGCLCRSRLRRARLSGGDAWRGGCASAASRRRRRAFWGRDVEAVGTRGLHRAGGLVTRGADGVVDVGRLAVGYAGRDRTAGRVVVIDPAPAGSCGRTDRSRGRTALLAWRRRYARQHQILVVKIGSTVGPSVVATSHSFVPVTGLGLDKVFAAEPYRRLLWTGLVIEYWGGKRCSPCTGRSLKTGTTPTSAAPDVADDPVQGRFRCRPTSPFRDFERGPCGRDRSA